MKQNCIAGARAVALVIGAGLLTLAGTSTAAFPLRLTDTRSDTPIESPTSTAFDLLQDPALLRKSILLEDFANTRSLPLGVLRSPGCDVATRPDGRGPALRYERRKTGRCARLVSVKPSTFYWVERELATTSPSTDLIIIEARFPLLSPDTPNHADDVARLLSKNWVKRDAALAVHRFRHEAQTQGFERNGILLLTTPMTRSLVLLVGDAEAEDGPLGDSAFIDNLVVDALSPSPAQEVALLERLDRRAQPIASALPRTANGPPNVILVTVGGLRADRLGLYGYPRPTSKALDSLAQQATVFESAVSPGNSSRFVVPAILSGVPPKTLALMNRARELSRDVRTLAEHFAASGFVTAAVVSDEELVGQGLDRGFGEVHLWPRGARAERLVAAAKHFTQSHSAEPFLLWVHLSDPLQPFDPPEAAVQKLLPAFALGRFGLTLPFSVSNSGEVPGCARCSSAGKVSSPFLSLTSDLYDCEVAGLDHELGDLFQTLAAVGLWEKSVVAVAATHGEIIWDRGNRFGHPKDDLSDPVVRVPLIIKPAGVVRPKRVPAQVRLLDLFPTLLDLAGASLPTSLNTTASLAPVCLGSSSTPITERVAVSNSRKTSAFAVRTRDFKLVGAPSDTGTLVLSLYDLSRDPKEQRDISREHPDIVERLLLQAVDAALTHRLGTLLLIALPKDARGLKLHVRSATPVSAIEALFALLPHLSSGRTTFDLTVAALAGRFLVVRLANLELSSLDVDVVVTGKSPQRLRQTVELSGTLAPPSETLARLLRLNRIEVLMVAMPGAAPRP